MVDNERQRRASQCGVLAVGERGVIKRLGCGLWGCEECAKKNARMWAWRVAIESDKQAHLGYSAHFVTLTMPPSVGSVDDAFAALPDCWDKFRRAVEKIDKTKKWVYCAFVEGQARRAGMPHLHVLAWRVQLDYRTTRNGNLSAHVGAKRLKDLAVSCGFGHQADAKPVTGAGAAAYCAKYAGKGHDAFPKSFRRVRASLGFATLPAQEEKEIWLVREKKEGLADYIYRCANEFDLEFSALWDAFLAAAARAAPARGE